ncbi:C40 family peptidase [uncultured Aeromicrobium sp.]|uniref:C40 family peptidase n=1 Tax=uncultured Aeromicrobium sp. TaxID=337820 RepID=UPI0025F0E3D0|nr:C40 family peptidase [uncultured Aeromicrobium sp.]
MCARRLLATPLVAILALLATTVAPSVAAPDEEDRVAQIQVQLVEARQGVNALYAQAAAAAEQFNAAVETAEAAERELAGLDDQIAAAERELEGERSVVEELTMEELTAQQPVVVLQSFLDAEGPLQLIERSSAYASTQDAMAGRIAQLDAKQAVVRSVRAQAAEAAQRRRDAVDRQASLRREIQDTIAAADRRREQLNAERTVLLAELAELEDTTLDAVRARQDRIDSRIDARQASPDRDAQADSAPTLPAPSPARPSPAPAPPPAPSPAPAPPPAPAPAPAPPPAPAPAPNPNRVEAMIGYARAQLGKPYGWGAAGPGSFDCSGLTLRALEAAGTAVPRTAGAQYAALRKITPSQRQRGDLLFWSNGSAASIDHVAIYLGDGEMIHAPRPGRSVEIVPVDYWIQPDLAARPFA